jgi:hypothetical protein
MIAAPVGRPGSTCGAPAGCPTVCDCDASTVGGRPLIREDVPGVAGLHRASFSNFLASQLGEWLPAICGQRAARGYCEARTEPWSPRSCNRA